VSLTGPGWSGGEEDVETRSGEFIMESAAATVAGVLYEMCVRVCVCMCVCVCGDHVRPSRDCL